MVKTIQVNGEMIIPGTRGALVASRSEPGAWHLVHGGKCDCLGYEYRGRCRHVAAVDALSSARVDAQPNPTFALAERTLAGAFAH